MKLIAIVAAAMLIPTGARAAEIGTTVTANGSYSGDLGVLNDGFVPPNGSVYSGSYAVHDYGATAFTFTFAGETTVTDFLASVDNNDDYVIAFYDGANFVRQYAIPAGAGSVGGGLDTFSSFPYPGATEIATPASFLATSAIVTSSGGDGLYALGEVEFFDNSAPAAVPEATTWAMMLAGFGSIGGGLRNSRLRRTATAS